MPLTSLLDSVRQYLDATLTPAPKLIGGGVPTEASELPAVALSLADAAERLRGVGRMPAPTIVGALAVESSLDLANPVVAFPDEVVRLLSDDRRTVALAHGPLVRADGTPDQPFAPEDIHVVRGATTFTPVAGTPGAGEVQVQPEAGRLVFASALRRPGRSSSATSSASGRSERLATTACLPWTSSRPTSLGSTRSADGSRPRSTNRRSPASAG